MQGRQTPNRAGNGGRPIDEWFMREVLPLEYVDPVSATELAQGGSQRFAAEAMRGSMKPRSANGAIGEAFSVSDHRNLMIDRLRRQAWSACAWWISTGERLRR
jgi:hypothetical protein